MIGAVADTLDKIDLSYPLLIFFILFWAFLGLSGILTTIVNKTHLFDKIKQWLHDYRERHHGHSQSE